jgi:uncharacterized protein (DUF608 family)
MPQDDREAGRLTLFPTDLPASEWAEFPAQGFSAPVSGVIYRLGNRVTNGLPLGALDAGCIDLETSGLLGYCTIFNSHVPRRGPLNAPLLGLSVGGRTWVLCDPAQTKPYLTGAPGEATAEPPPPLDLRGVETATQVHYWGHYPVADLEFETDAPVGIGLRAWAPFLPGDVAASLMPAIVFEVHLRNLAPAEQRGAVALSFPGPTAEEAGAETFARRETSADGFAGVVVEAPLSSYALGLLADNPPRTGGELGADGPSWARIADELPAAPSDHAGASVAADFVLAPGETAVVRFALTWHSPQWKGGGHPGSPDGNTFTHMYAAHYPGALAAAATLGRDHADLLARVLAWQEVIYADASLPAWLRDSLVNILHLIPETGMWAQAGPPLPDWVRRDDGLFGMDECPRACPQIECIPCSFYGNLPVVYFFPEAALSTLRGYLGYQDADGAPPWIFGGATAGTPPVEFAMPSRGYQVTMNGPCYADLVHRYLLCYGDAALLREFLPSVKAAVAFTLDLNRGPDGIISMPDRRVSVVGMEWESEWFEFYEWHGMAAHAGGVHLAMLRMAEAMAAEAGDEAFAAQCRAWLDAGASSMETKMWNGVSYLNFWDEDAGLKCDHVFACQLDGDWMAKSHGLAPVFRPDRAATVLDTVRRFNVALTRYGATDMAHADGTPLAPGEWPIRGFYQPDSIFVPEVFMLGMTYMYAGDVDFGLELARRILHGIVCEQGEIWDQPNMIQGNSGELLYGTDYYQNLMLWALPAAMAGEDLGGPCRTGGLVARILAAAKGGMGS